MGCQKLYPGSLSMVLKRIVWQVLLLLLIGFSMGQVIAQVPAPNRWYKKGLEAFEQHDYPKAEEYFEWSSQKGGGWKSDLMLARTYREQLDYAKAKDWYAKVVEQPGIPASTYFYYAQCLLATKDYPAAQQWFDRFAEMEPQNPKSVVFRDLDKIVRSFLADTMQYKVQKLPINSTFSDFSPCYFQDGIYFVSGRPNELGVKHINVLDGAELLDIYFAALDSAGRWSKPKLVNSLNSNYNEGPMAIDTSHQHLYLTRNNPQFTKEKNSKKNNHLNRLRIEGLTWINGNWADPKPLPICNPDFAVGHPTLSADGLTMYFASDMPGGFGGTDLYKVMWDGESWTGITNLGDRVNTSEDELFPYLSSEGELYFSSSGHLGFGGLDIFYCQLLGNGGFGRVQNLGYPINSERDDFGLIAAADGNSGYFSSNRGSGSFRNDDLYSYQRDWPRFDCAPMLKTNYCYLYSDEGVLDIDTLPFAYEWRFGDGFKARGLDASHCYEGPGTYEIGFYIYDTIANQVFLNVNNYFLTIKDTEQVSISIPDTLIAGEKIAISAEKSVLPGCELERYFWEFGDGQRAQGISQMHTYADTGRYEIKLGVTGKPESNSELVCKNCVTKLVQVVTRPEMEQIAEARIARKKLALARQATWEKPENLPHVKYEVDTIAPPVFDAAAPNDTLLPALQHQLNQLNTATQVQDEQERQVLNQDAVPGRNDTIPTNKLGQPSSDIKASANDSRKVTPTTFGKRELPASDKELGSSVYVADILDSKGNPIVAQFTVQDLESGMIKYQANSDSKGHLELNLPKGQIYAWTANMTNFLPASGFFDLRSEQQAGRPDSIQKATITLQTVPELLKLGEPLRLNNIFFDFDSDNLRPESIDQLDRLARLLSSDPALRIEVSAHTDNVGDDGYNMDLSRRRAYSVVRYMVMAGYNVEQLTPVGFGETQPFVPNDSPMHRQINRRVEFKFLPQH